MLGALSVGQLLMQADIIQHEITLLLRAVDSRNPDLLIVTKFHVELWQLASATGISNWMIAL
jgi:hypothetical protein